MYRCSFPHASQPVTDSSRWFPLVDLGAVPILLLHVHAFPLSSSKSPGAPLRFIVQLDHWHHPFASFHVPSSLVPKHSEEDLYFSLLGRIAHHLVSSHLFSMQQVGNAHFLPAHITYQRIESSRMKMGPDLSKNAFRRHGANPSKVCSCILGGNGAAIMS